MTESVPAVQMAAAPVRVVSAIDLTGGMIISTVPTGQKYFYLGGVAPTDSRVIVHGFGFTLEDAMAGNVWRRVYFSFYKKVPLYVHGKLIVETTEVELKPGPCGVCGLGGKYGHARGCHETD